MKTNINETPSMGATREILLPPSTSEELVASMEKAEELVATSEMAEEPTAPTETAENDTTSPEAMTDINATPDVPEDVSTQAKETTPELPASSETTEENMPEEPTEIMHNYVPPFSEHIHKITSDTPTCEIIIMSPADLEDKMAHGWDDAVRSYDEPSEALLNSPEYRDSMIVKPEDLVDDPANLINEFRRIIAEKDAELEKKDRIIETLRGESNGEVAHAASVQDDKTEQASTEEDDETEQASTEEDDETEQVSTEEDDETEQASTEEDDETEQASTEEDNETEQVEQTIPDKKASVSECITFTPQQLAAFLGLGQNMTYNLIKEEGFPAIRSEGGKYWIFKDKVEDWFLEHPEIVLKSTNTKSKKSSKKATEAKAEKKSTKASAKKKEKGDAKKKTASKAKSKKAA